MEDAKKEPRSGQGRSKRQIESTYKILEWTFLGFLASLLIAVIMSYFNIGI
jgi:hypothetical protein